MKPTDKWGRNDGIRKSPFSIQIIILRKDHQQILKLVGDSLMTGYSHSLKISPHKIPIHCKKKKQQLLEVTWQSSLYQLGQEYHMPSDMTQ